MTSLSTGPSLRKGLGIYLQSCDNIRVQSNEVDYVDASTSAPSIPRNAIRVESGSRNFLYDNYVESDTIFGSDTLVRGIMLDRCPNSWLLCNTAYDFGVGMIYERPSYPGTVLSSNKMWAGLNGSIGMELLNNGWVGQQGHQNSASGNQWTGTFASSQTFSNVSPGNNSIHFVRYWIGDEKPTVNDSSQGTSVKFVNVDSSNYWGPWTCPHPSGWTSIGVTPDPDSSYFIEIKNIAEDQDTYFVWQDNHKWTAKYFLFGQIEMDPGLKDSTAFGNFWDNNTNGGIGICWRLAKAFTTGDLSAAESELSSLSPSNLTETNLKSVYTVMLDVFSSDSISLDSNQLDTLMGVAEQCPDAGGIGVHIARSFLSLADTSVYEPNECDESDKTHYIRPDQNAKFTENWHVEAYPNPADQKVTIELKGDIPHGSTEIRVTDLMGQILFSFALDPRSTKMELDFAGLASGLYSWDAQNGGKHFSGKFLIQR